MQAQETFLTLYEDDGKLKSKDGNGEEKSDSGSNINKTQSSLISIAARVPMVYVAAV